MNRFYFDHNATTPVCEEVLNVYLPLLREVYGNASSTHHFGQEASRRLEGARGQVARLLGAHPAEIVFTSGGTEADNLALLGIARASGDRRKHVITTSIEHPAVMRACEQLGREGADVTYVPVGASGVVDPDDIRRALTPYTVLISVMHVNNEIGTIQPVERIAAIAREAGVPFHSDGVQAVGKVVFPTGPVGDLYTMSGHKFYAPKGVGVLYVRQGTRLAPALHGGHQERDRRPGTQNVPAAVALGEAARWAVENTGRENVRLARLRDRLEQGVLGRVPGTAVNGSGARVANTSNIRFDGVYAGALLIALDLGGFAVSSGAACSSGAVEPSHVLTAIGLTQAQARSSLRISLGRGNSGEQVDALVETVSRAVTELRKVSTAAVGRG